MRRESSPSSLGLVGVAVIVRPATGHVDPGQLIALAAAVGFAHLGDPGQVADPQRKRRRDHLLDAGRAVGDRASCRRCWSGDGRRWRCWPWIFVVACCGTYSHYCMTRALRHADATTSCRWTSCAFRSRPPPAGSSTRERVDAVHRARRGADPRRQPAQPANRARRSRRGGADRSAIRRALTADASRGVTRSRRGKHRSCATHRRLPPSGSSRGRTSRTRAAHPRTRPSCSACSHRRGRA